MTTKTDLILAAAFIFTGFAIGCAVGTMLERQGSRQRAIEAKVGRFIVDDKTGNVEFIFLTPEKAPDLPEIYEQKAIEAGAAFWSIDERTGIRKFNYTSANKPIPNPTPAPKVEKTEKTSGGISIDLKKENE